MIRATGTVLVDAGSITMSADHAEGGSVSIWAHDVLLTNGALVSATSSGPGDAGSVIITARGAFRSRDSAVTTEAEQADGGNITLTVGAVVHLMSSVITATVKGGEGKGGNIVIDPQFVVLDHSRIRADAFGGPGGNVQIVADVYLTMDSLVSASSTLGMPGTVDIQASITDVSGSVAQLPAALLQAATLLRASCAARLGEGKASSLVLAGRDGVPLEPGGMLAGFLFGEGAASPSAEEDRGHTIALTDGARLAAWIGQDSPGDRPSVATAGTPARDLPLVRQCLPFLVQCLPLLS